MLNEESPSQGHLFDLPTSDGPFDRQVSHASTVEELKVLAKDDDAFDRQISNTSTDCGDSSTWDSHLPDVSSVCGSDYTDNTDEAEVKGPLRQLLPQVPVPPKGDMPREALLARLSSQVKSSKADTAENWLKSRLSDLNPSDFQSSGVAICTTMPMEVPSAFQDVSYSIRFHRGVALFQAKDIQLVRDSELILMFCDICDDEQLKLAWHMSSHIGSLGADAPHLVLVPHAMQESGPDVTFAAWSNAKDTVRMDAMILGEPTGFKLACEVRSQLMMSSKRVKNFNAQVEDQRRKVDHAETLKHNIQVVVWEYFIYRLGLPIPALDYSIVCEQGATIGNLKVGQELGSGSSGKVYKLESCRSAKNTMQVIKMIPKSDKESFRALGDLCNEVNIMEELNHPNIIKLYQVYHAETHILIRMQDGGAQDLYNYLKRLEVKRLPLSPLRAERVVTQCLGALCHMHLVASVVHHDIKPENIVVRETAQGIVIKLCDFDLSRIRRKGSLALSKCGTFPFIAPEIGEGPYDPFPTDIWSMAIVFLEVTCCCRVLTKAVSYYSTISDADRAPADRNPKEVTSAMIRNFLEVTGSVSRMVERYVRNELKGAMKSSMTTLLEGMSTVQADQRVTAEALSDVETWPVASLFSEPA